MDELLIHRDKITGGKYDLDIIRTPYATKGASI